MLGNFLYFPERERRKKKKKVKQDGCLALWPLFTKSHVYFTNTNSLSRFTYTNSVGIKIGSNWKTSDPISTPASPWQENSVGLFSSLLHNKITNKTWNQKVFIFDNRQVVLLSIASHSQSYSWILLTSQTGKEQQEYDVDGKHDRIKNLNVAPEAHQVLCFHMQLC